MYFGGRSLKKYMKASTIPDTVQTMIQLTCTPHLLGSSFWCWNVINCPGGCTIDNHIRPGSVVIARCN